MADWTCPNCEVTFDTYPEYFDHTRKGCSVTLPCGCILHTVVIHSTNTLQYFPCSLNCPNYLNAIGEANKKGKPIETRRA
jgi:hypothetical protein